MQMAEKQHLKVPSFFRKRDMQESLYLLGMPKTANKDVLEARLQAELAAPA